MSTLISLMLVGVVVASLIVTIIAAIAHSAKVAVPGIGFTLLTGGMLALIGKLAALPVLAQMPSRVIGIVMAVGIALLVICGLVALKRHALKPFGAWLRLKRKDRQGRQLAAVDKHVDKELTRAQRRAEDDAHRERLKAAQAQARDRLSIAGRKAGVRRGSSQDEPQDGIHELGLDRGQH